MGVETRTALAEADIVVFVVDASTGIQVEDLEIMAQIEDKRKLVVINKTDICGPQLECGRGQEHFFRHKPC